MPTNPRPHETAATPANLDLCSVVVHGIRTPLAVLRASLDSLALSFDGDDPRARTLRGAAEQLAYLSHTVRDLIDYQLPAPTRPLGSTVEEIALGALAGLEPELRRRVVPAIESPGERLVVDASQLSRALARLVASSLGLTDDPVMVSARAASGTVHFGVVAAAHARGREALEGDPTLQLAWALAARDVQRNGGRIQRSTSPDGRVIIAIELGRAVEVAA